MIKMEETWINYMSDTDNNVRQDMSFISFFSASYSYFPRHTLQS